MKRHFFICIIFLFVIAAVCHAEERWALLVGIDRYSSDIITPLKGAVRDARGLRDVLIEHARFPSDNVFCLASDDESNLPNLGNIVTKLDYIASEAKKGDLFLFFFAGHGITFNEQNFLLTYESDIRPFLLPKTGLSVEELNGYLGKIQSGNTILILDACRNSPGAGRGDEDNLMTDSFMRSIGVKPKEENTEDIEFNGTIYSCNVGERAYEWPGKERGFFTITLEDALSGKADEGDSGNGDGEVTINEVELYLNTRVPKLVRQELGSEKKQTPRIVRSGDPRAGDKVFSWVAEGQGSKTVSSYPGEIAVSRELAVGPDQLFPSKTSDPGEMEGESDQPLSPIDQAKQKREAFFEELSDWEAQADEEGTSESGLTQQQREEGWIQVTGEYRGAEITPVQAQEKALGQAERNAIIEALGMESGVQKSLLLWETLYDFQRRFPSLSQSALYNEIIEEQKADWTYDSIQQNSDEPPVPLYRVILRAKVAKAKTIPDPGFGLSLRLNKEAFQVGDEMILSITSTQYCYIAVFSVLSDDTVLVVYPAQGRTSKRISGGESFSLPSETESLLVTVPSGSAMDVGSMLVIATKYNIPFLPEVAKEFHPGVAVPDGKEVLPTYQTTLEEINGWLMGIPMDKRVFDVKQYKIEKE